MHFLQQSFFRPSFEDKPTWRVPPDDAINNEEWMEHVRKTGLKRQTLITTVVVFQVAMRKKKMRKR